MNSVLIFQGEWRWRVDTFRGVTTEHITIEHVTTEQATTEQVTGTTEQVTGTTEQVTGYYNFVGFSWLHIHMNNMKVCQKEDRSMQIYFLFFQIYNLLNYETMIWTKTLLLS